MGKRRPIYILVGTPGSGKSWIASQTNVRSKFKYISHDIHDGNEKLVRAVAEAARNQKKPVLTDTPFSLSQIQEPLKKMGFDVKPVFIIETPEVTRERYESRYKETGMGQPTIPKGHLSRINTFLDRAANTGAPNGTSSEMLQYLESVDIGAGDTPASDGLSSSE